MPHGKPLIARFTQPVREAPTLLLALAALALFVAWAADQAGYPVTHWAPGGLIVLALLAIALLSVPLRLRALPPALWIALAALALFTLLSFLSITWAGVRGDAWEGANRTLLYLLVFALFACWRMRGANVALLLSAWSLAMIALAAFVFLHLDAQRSLAAFFKGERLVYPDGYENANAATWAMVCWPALLLAAAPRMPWAARGALAGGIVLLADLSLLSQSRGALFATPVMILLVFALCPGRLRTFAVLAPVAAGIAATAPLILRVGDRLHSGGDARGALHSATVAVFLAAALVGAAVAIGAALEGRRALAPGAQQIARRALAVAAVGAALAVLIGGWVALGDPAARIRHAWNTFTSGKGYAANGSGNRLVSGLGSNRYDFYRVAFDQFRAHPLVGIGADNFQQPYLVHGHSGETPRYPHSVELRTLSQTGVIGALIALAGLVAALTMGARALRAPRGAPADPLRSSAAAAALAGFAYWLVHGSVDWFWEFAGLGAPAFALLGLACALALPPRSERPAPETAPALGPAEGPVERSAQRARTAGRPAAGRRVALAGGAVAAVAIVASLGAVWLSQLQLEDAARIWRTNPRGAFAALDDAARLDPLGAQPYLLAGSIALRFGETAHADREFSLALKRSPKDSYAMLERGAIASARGERARALALLERAAALDPRNEETEHALALARRGGRVNVSELNLEILRDSRLFA